MPGWQIKIQIIIHLPVSDIQVKAESLICNWFHIAACGLPCLVMFEPLFMRFTEIFLHVFNYLVF